MRVADIGVDPRIVEILKKQGIEELYPPQGYAIGPALLGENLVLAIPTASGKSLVAYLAILAAVMRGGKALYIVPLSALAAEKYEALKDFEPLGIKVGISVGDYDSADPTLEKLDVIVATSERADSLLRHRTNWLQRLSVVVADEVHLINDADRGPTLEVTLAKLRQVNPQSQVLALSATIKNSEELARWLEAEHITSEWRPVPLKQGVYFDGLVHFTDQTVQEVKVREDDMSGLVTDVLASGGQALVFVNTRRSTEALAKSLAKEVRAVLGEKELDHLNKLAEQLVRGQEEATSMASRLGKCIDGGVAFHHAGLTNDQRNLVEKEFKKGRVKCIVATPTLSMGVDTPARRVVIRDLNRFDVNLGLTPIPVMEVKQMCGRAGRPRYDPYGEAILFAKDEDDIDELMEDYFLSEPEAIESKLGSEPALRMHILANIATGHVGTEEELFSFFNRTFFAFTGDVHAIRGKILEVVEDYDFFLAEVKTASLLDDWITERTEEEVTKKFGIGPGDIRRMTDQAEWLLYSMGELGRIFNKKKVRALTRLTIQVQYGIKEELLELISLRGVGRVRGRALFQRGFKTLKDLQKANPSDLARIPTIGPTLAMKIKEQVGVPVDVREIEGQAALGDFP